MTPGTRRACRRTACRYSMCSSARAPARASQTCAPQRPRSAGFEWRRPVCSMCLAMHDDALAPGQRCASNTNRDFEGAPGSGSDHAPDAPGHGRSGRRDRLRQRCPPTGGRGMGGATTIEGIAAVIAVDKLDTDQTMPSVRLNIGGTRFGCGSRRAHAVWGLQQFGIGAVIAARFGAIVDSSGLNSGLLAVMLPSEDVQALIDGAGPHRGSAPGPMLSLGGTGPGDAGGAMWRVGFASTWTTPMRRQHPNSNRFGHARRFRFSCAAASSLASRNPTAECPVRSDRAPARHSPAPARRRAVLASGGLARTAG